MTKTCADCDDTGWVQATVDGVSGVRSCRCRERKIAAMGRFDPFGAWPIPPTLGDSTIKNFKKRRSGCGGLGDAQDGAKGFVKRIKGGEFHGGIMFSGGPGIGKSHLCAGIVESVDRRAHWIQTADFMASLRRTFNAAGDSAEDLITEVQEVSLLVLDDLGAERLTGYAEETIYRIVDARYRERRPVVITTNRRVEESSDPDVLSQHIGARTYDRILGMCWHDEQLDVYRLTGPSFRWGGE